MTVQRRSRSVWMAMILATTAAIVGLWTLHRHNPAASPLDLVFWTLQMFTADSLEPSIRPSDLMFSVARVLAPLATFIAVMGVCMELMADRFARLRIRNYRDHTVLCGLNDGGRDLALRERMDGHDVVVITAMHGASDEAFCGAHRIGHLNGDARDPVVLEAAAIACAKRLVIVTGEDTTNLDVASVGSRLLTTVRRKVPLRMFAAINDGQLWDDLSRSDAIRRQSANCEFTAFNPKDLVARRFFWNEPIWRAADLRDLTGVHAVFLGCGAYGQVLIVQLLRACVYRDFAKPKVTVLCVDPAAEQRRLRLLCGEIDDLADIEFGSFDPGGEALDATLMIQVERRSPVTAVFVCVERDDNALRTAIYARDSIHRHGRWRAPVYVRMNRFERVKDLIEGTGDSRRFEDVLHFFGSDAEHCDLEMIDGELEQLARRMHEAYRAARASRIEGNNAISRQEPLAAWVGLRETYREANRRSANHVKAKLESAGCLIPAGASFVAPADFRLGAPPALREALAGLEHRFWALGRRLDGWRPGTRRDNIRRIHNNLVDYEALPESLKDYDRDRIDLVDTQLVERREGLATDAPALRRDHWIGLSGCLRVRAEEAEWARQVLVDQVLPGLLARHEHAHLTVVTPLAPGLDLVLTRVVLTALASQRRAHRLLVVEGVPESQMLDDCRQAFEAGYAWDGEPREPDEHWMEVARPDAGGRARIAAERRRIVSDPACERLIGLTQPDVDYTVEANRERGYRVGTDYIARRAHTLIVATHGGAEARSCGCMEILQRRPKLLAARLAGWPVAEPCSSVLLDMETRRITVRIDADNTLADGQSGSQGCVPGSQWLS